MQRLRPRSCVSVAFASLVAGLGCKFDYTPSDNVLPEAGDEGTTSDGDTQDEVGTEDSGTETGDGDALPTSYRFDCVDIKSMGDADETVFQVQTLQNTWAADINNYKLNILIDVLSEDPVAGEGAITIRSGIGTDASDQCSQSETESPEFPVGYVPMVSEWEPVGGEECAGVSDVGGSGTYTLEMAADERVFIYAQDTDGTVFNCSTAGQPNAIPIWAATSTFTMSVDRNTLSGTMTGCVSQGDAEAICSCLSVCGDADHPDCGGCPTGSVPLGLLLGGINPTPNCSDLLGAPAFDIVLEFNAGRLGGVPETCG